MTHATGGWEVSEEEQPRPSRMVRVPAERERDEEDRGVYEHACVLSVSQLSLGYTKCHNHLYHGHFMDKIVCI
jgi:hypothetical protein